MLKKTLLCLLATASLACTAQFKYDYKPYPRFFRASWLWAGSKTDVPMTAALRRVIQIDEPVRKAWFYAYWDKAATFYFNGKKLKPLPWKKNLPPTFGHVRGSGVDLTPLIQQGKNVLAVSLKRNKVGCYGLILRGEIELVSGKKISLLSTGEQFKASGSPAKGWELPSFDDARWRPAFEQGGPDLKPWSTYGNVAKLYSEKKEYDAYVKFMNKGFPAEQLAKESDRLSAKIVYKKHIPGIEINGKVYPPVVTPVFNSNAPDRDALVSLSGKAGIKIFCLPLNIFEMSADYRSQIDLSMRRLLAMEPEAYVLFTYREIVPPRWLKQNPDEAAAFAVKSKYTHYTSYAATPFTQSLASDKFLQLIDGAIADFAKYALAQPWGKRVLGVKNGHGPSGDGMPAGAHCMPDTGKRMTEKFRLFLKNKYKTDAALQKAWGDSQVTLATARVPDQTERWGSGMYLRDSGDPKDRRVMDYYVCYHQVFNAYILSMMKSIKKHFPGRLAGCVSGYIILGYSPEGSTACFESLLKSPYVDLMWATTRGYNLTDGLHRNLHSAFQRYGKLSSIEADIRTHIDKKAEKFWQCRTPEETRATMSKVVANSLINGCGYHLNNFGRSGAFVIPEIIEPIASGIRLWKKLYAAPPAKGADIAVIVDPEPVWLHGHPDYGKNRPMADTLITFPLQALNFSGFSYDLLGYEDFLKSAHPYKCVVFLNAFNVSAPLRKALQKKLRKPGVTAVWHYAPGLLTERGYSEKAMQDLTGITLKLQRKALPLTAVTADKKQMAPLNYRMPRSPRISAADKNAEVLAVYTDKTAAFIRKKLADGSTAVFAGVPICHADIWSRLLTEAGCRRYTRPGFMVRSNASGMLEIFSIADGNIAPESILQAKQVNRSGQLELHVPAGVRRLKDVFTGKIYQVKNNKLLLKNENKRPQCWLFLPADHE